MKRFALGALLALAACDGATHPRDAAIAGKWLYHANVGACDVTAVLRMSETGSTVTAAVPPVAAGCSASFGFFSLPADSAATLSGRVYGDSVTFTLRAWGSELVHTAAVQGDSMSGTVSGAGWLPAGIPSTPGTFGARRYTTQVLPDRFRMVLTGAVNDSLEGRTHADQFGPLFTMDDGTGAGGLTKQVNVGGFPLTPGTYPVYDRTVQRDSVTGGVVYRGGFYRFRDSTATITRVTGDELEGTFDVTAYLTSDTTRKVRVQGGFHPHYTIVQ
ncbi:hypothetical protein [Longimicrobium sp.]|uniref:hypothetical protein n=1 Tax=Longimicrobium sp. TaxID=2029185 RepID=UPI002BEC4ABA|nr:hypothetical protein [Longimicrobium sp.]HSU14903.1 hypothetical protein [Longimicrobium sp.]